MDEVPSSFTIAFVQGVTLTRWTSAWATRQRRVPLAFIAADVTNQVTALRDGSADVSFVRLPIERAGLSVIPLYSETPVVIVPKDHPVAVVESITLAELQSEDQVDASLSAEDAVELVAVGGGIVILPQSIARLHARKDVVARPVTDAVPTEIAIAWLEENTTSWVEEFVGIVRGRTAASSRAVPTPKAQKPRKEPAAKNVRRGIQRQKPRRPRAR